MIIGALALRLAIGSGGGAEDAQGAVEIIGHQPFGRVVLAVLALGFFSHTLWRMMQAVLDADELGSSVAGLSRRIMYGGLGVAYAVLGWIAAKFALLGEKPEESGGEHAQSMTAELLSLPFGAALVTGAGIIFAAMGIWRLKQAFKADFMQELNASKMSLGEKRVANVIGRFGLASRAVTYGIIGWFLVEAARQRDPGEARGLREALLEIVRQPYGPTLLSVVAAGLGAYGLHCLVQARYRHLHTV